MPRIKTRGRPSGSKTAGQPAGTRSASGRKRDRAPERISPCEGIIRRRDLYRVHDHKPERTDEEGKKVESFYTDTCDAIGRAYCAGLLGSGERAKDLLVAGRKIARQYWRVYVDGPVSSNALARFFPIEPGKPMTMDERHEQDRILEAALRDALSMVEGKSRDHRRAFDQLVIDMHPDFGPSWLDQIVWSHRHNKRAGERDYTWLRLAVEALETVA